MSLSFHRRFTASRCPGCLWRKSPLAMRGVFLLNAILLATFLAAGNAAATDVAAAVRAAEQERIEAIARASPAAVAIFAGEAGGARGSSSARMATRSRTSTSSNPPAWR